MNRTEEEIREFKEEVRQEMKENAYCEKLMYEDEEYAVKQFEDEILEATKILENISTKLATHGHELTMSDLINYY